MPIASKTPLDSLIDPAPPVPGDAERAAVSARANQLVKRRRMVQGAGALACTAILGVGVVALVSSTGSGSGSGANKVEAASAPETGTNVTNPSTLSTAPAETAAAPATEPAPAAEEPAATETQDAPAAAEEPESTPAPEPVLASLSVNASSVPAGVTLQVTLVGDGGTFAATTTSGVVSFADVPPGTYELRWSWESGDGAAAVGRETVTLGEGPNTVSF
jgi:hypothetical protein